MPRSMTTCPSGQSSRVGVLVTDPCDTNAFTGIPLMQEATVCQILTRDANSAIALSQRAPGIWSLDAESTINLLDVAQGPGPGGTALHVLNHTAESIVDLLSDHACTTGGRAVQTVTKCVTQTGHGLVVGDWIILDSVTGDWTQAFDGGATIEDDAVAQVISVTDSDNFCYKPIGPITQATGLLPGRTYYVETDGSGDLTLTEPGDTSVPRLFAISSSEGILLPYRPIDPTTSGGSTVCDVFDIDSTDVSNGYVTLSDTPIADSEDVYLNGLHLIKGGSRDYTISGGTQVNFAVGCLVVGDTVKIKFKKT